MSNFSRSFKSRLGLKAKMSSKLYYAFMLICKLGLLSRLRKIEKHVIKNAIGLNSVRLRKSSLRRKLVNKIGLKLIFYKKLNIKRLFAYRVGLKSKVKRLGTAAYVLVVSIGLASIRLKKMRIYRKLIEGMALRALFNRRKLTARLLVSRIGLKSKRSKKSMRTIRVKVGLLAYRVRYFEELLKLSLGLLSNSSRKLRIRKNMLSKIGVRTIFSRIKHGARIFRIKLGLYPVRKRLTHIRKLNSSLLGLNSAVKKSMKVFLKVRLGLLLLNVRRVGKILRSRIGIRSDFDKNLSKTLKSRLGLQAFKRIRIHRVIISSAGFVSLRVRKLKIRIKLASLLGLESIRSKFIVRIEKALIGMKTYMGKIMFIKRVYTLLTSLFASPAKPARVFKAVVGLNTSIAMIKGTLQQRRTAKFTNYTCTLAFTRPLKTTSFAKHPKEAVFSRSAKSIKIWMWRNL